MKRKNILTALLLLLVAACKKEGQTEKGQIPAYGFSIDEVKTWYKPESGIAIDWSQAEHHETKTMEYWLVGISGRPQFAGLKLGYRRLIFYKDGKGNINEQMLEVIPDALYLQRVRTVSENTFTGRVFIFDRSHTLLGGLSYNNGQKVGEIKPASQDTSTIHLHNTELNCSWYEDNYVDSDGNAVVYAERVCDPFYMSGASGGFGDGSAIGSSPVSTGNAGISTGHGESGGSSGTAASPPAPSNLPGESGPGINTKDFMKCFANIPDQGATMKITIYVQEPFPGTTFNLGPNSVGHTAIGLTKTNGSQSITQIVGFYPDATGLDKMHAPSKVVDNSALNYNVSITYNVTADNFQKISNYIASPPATYDLVNFNCTNFVYDACKNGKIALPDPYNSLGPASPPGADLMMAPAGLGDSIENMKGQTNVNTNGGTAPISKGSCN